MKRIMRELRPFRIPILMVLVLGLVYVVLNFILPTYKNYQASKTPIVKIEASNQHVYKQGTKFRESDFIVEAEHESGRYSTLSSDAYTISPKAPDPVGDYTKVTISLKEKPNKKTTVKVKNDRKVVASIPCGKPKLNAVKAVIYSNGELAFEGEGDVLQYNYNEYPWKGAQDVEIKSVTFEKGVAPTSMDYWFSGMTGLTYIDSLPESVESIVGMCSGCTLLEEAPKWDNCSNLLDVTEAYYGCTNLMKVPPLTSSIKTATSMLQNCIMIQDAPDLSAATSLKNTSYMYNGCKSMTTATTMPPNVEKMDGMFADCINLKQMPEIPGSVKFMESSFLNNMSLRQATKIPGNVKNVANCFSGCSKLKGEMQIDANPESISGFLQGACSATNLNLVGGSKLLNDLALTNDTDNITVNGAKPIMEN